MKSMKQNENIGNFLKAAETIGVDRMDLFQVRLSLLISKVILLLMSPHSNLILSQSVNIIQNQNMAQVLATLSRLGSAAEARGVKGAKFGVKTANKNERVFDEATKQAGKGIIGLQVSVSRLLFRIEYVDEPILHTDSMIFQHETHEIGYLYINL